MRRSFTQLRARLLLFKQDQLSILEQQLEEIDQREVSPLFLGSSRCDRNAERIALLSKIDEHLKDYGTNLDMQIIYNADKQDLFAARTSQSLNFSPAQQRDIESLQHWLDGNGCLAREETAYLSCKDLVTLAPARDNALLQFETWVEDRIIRICHGFEVVRARNIPCVELTKRAEPFLRNLQ